MKTLTLNARDRSILIANALDHFDTALYGFLAPVLGPLFFPHADPLVQVILAYSVMATSLVTRPLGALLFGTLAWYRGPLKSLCYSLIGVALTTALIGFLPTYQDAGWLAPALLIVVRMIKGIFASGESTLAKLYILENKGRESALKASYLYQSSSLLGIILASSMATLVISNFVINWRVCFWLGGLVGFMALVLRRYTKSDDNLDHKNLLQGYKSLKFSLIWTHRINIMRTLVVSGFSHLTYAVPFVLMNTLVPLVTTMTLVDMMTLNTALLVVDLSLFPVIGRFSSKYNPIKVMTSAALVLSLTIIPLFYGLQNASWEYVTFVRFWFIIWGVLFACPLNFWLNSLFKMPEKYLCVGLGNAFGASIVGRTLTPLCLGLWYVHHNIFWPAFYLTLLTSLTALVVYSTKQE